MKISKKTAIEYAVMALLAADTGAWDEDLLAFEVGRLLNRGAKVHLSPSAIPLHRLRRAIVDLGDRVRRSVDGGVAQYAIAMADSISATDAELRRLRDAAERDAIGEAVDEEVEGRG